jgi:hypothetical protein
MKTCKIFFTISTILLFCNLHAAMINHTSKATPDVEMLDEGVKALYDAYEKNHEIALTSIEQSYKDKGKLLFIVIQTVNKAIQKNKEAMCKHLLIFISKLLNTIDSKNPHFSTICTSIQNMFRLSEKNKLFSFSELLLRSTMICTFIRKNNLFTPEIKKIFTELFLMSAGLESKKSFLKAALHANKSLHFLNDDVLLKANNVALKAECFDYIEIINDIDSSDHSSENDIDSSDHSSENDDADTEMYGSNNSNSSSTSSAHMPRIIDVDEDNNSEVTTESSNDGSSEERDRKSCFEYRDDHHDE